MQALKHRGRTPQFRASNGDVLRGSIAEIDYWRVGGIDQWVMIRGESLKNPLLVFLHGGPGFSEMRFFRRFNAPLERGFTVVQWDQRGSGKSFDSGIPRSSMTVEQFIADLDEVVERACQRTGQNKVTIFGHSWGSALGVLYADRFPHKVAAYVGSGQIGDALAGDKASYAFALEEAERQGNRKVLAKLRAIGPPPYSATNLWAERTALQRLEGNLRPRTLWGLARTILGGQESSILDLPNLLRGFRFSIDAMCAETSLLNLIEAVPALSMPVFFFLGRRDRWVPCESSVAYFDVLDAPEKKLVWFENSGHEPFVDEPDKFNHSMLVLVRPAATAELIDGSGVGGGVGGAAPSRHSSRRL